MVFLLAGDVFRHSRNTRVGNGKHSITAAPREFARRKLVGIDPMRRTTLEELHHLFDPKMGWKVNQGMNVVGIDIVDLHVEPLFGGLLRQVTRQFEGGGPGQERSPLQSGLPGEM
jgi:hypothetical protein